MWERAVQLEAKNAALLDATARLKRAVSLTDILAARKVVTSVGNFQVNIIHRSPKSQPGSQEESTRLHDAQAQNNISLVAQHGQSVDDGRPVFHWSGVDICQVARQRDDALTNAIALSSELTFAQRELFLTKSHLQVTRAAEQSASQV